MHQVIAQFSPPTANSRVVIHGHTAAGFERVRDAFTENFRTRHERGGGCCAYYRGTKVVDLWAGLRNARTGAPWEADTMVITYSATKGPAAMTMALLHSRGLLDYEKPVTAYWPEFGQHGKERITVRQLLAHQAGLFALDVKLTKELIADLDRLAEVLARQRPAWPPGSRQAYHAVTLGLYEGELLRRIDRQHRTLGQFFQEEIANPLELDLYIRLPESIPDTRLAVMSRPGFVQMLTGFPPRFFFDVMNRRSNINRALDGSALPDQGPRIYARNLEVPSGGGVGTARAYARAYSAFALGGELGLTPETLALLAAPAKPSANGFFDECVKGEARFSLGFMKPSPGVPFGNDTCFGAPGAGGAMGFADPLNQIGFGYVTCQMGTRLNGDPREVALRNAVYACCRSAG